MRILVHMKASARAAATVVTVILPVHVLLVLGSGIAALLLLIYIGIALPAVWSTTPIRRKAAAAVLGQILGAQGGRSSSTTSPDCPAHK